MSIPETGAIQRDIGDAQHALDSHQLGRWLRGSGHLNGGAATAAGGLTVEVPSDAEVLLDGETVAVDSFANTADVTSSGTMPRWSIISVQSDGSVTATDGDARQLVGDDSEPARVRDPAPPLNYPGVCYAAVFVPAGASEVTDDEILDRRLGASIRLASVLADQIEGESVLADQIEGESVLADQIEGESFGLPSGWALTENAAGEIVIEDSGGNVVFRRDETAGEWVTDSINAGSINTDEMNLDGLSGDLADRQNPKNHETRHHRGGPDELEVVDLDASSGTADDVPVVMSDGSLEYREAAGRSDESIAEIAVAYDFTGV